MDWNRGVGVTDSVERFSDRVANYVKYRPDYPREIVSYLVANCGLTRESVVADVGCGTGISSRMFLENGNRVFGVEPNHAMRAAAEKYLAQFPWFTAVDGTSDATTLEDDSVDLVVAAQAFHWFDAEGTRPEFDRILKPDGYTVLIWNERSLNADDFHREYEALLLKYANDYVAVRHDKIATAELAAFLGDNFGSAVFANSQTFDLEGLLGRLLSASYMPNENSPNHAALITDLSSLFAKYERDGRITVSYDTNVFHTAF